MLRGQEVVRKLSKTRADVRWDLIHICTRREGHHERTGTNSKHRLKRILSR